MAWIVEVSLSKHIFMLFSTLQCPKIKQNTCMCLKMTSSRSKLVLNIPQKSRSEIKGCLSAFSSQNCTLTKNLKRNTLCHSLESQITLLLLVLEKSPISYQQVFTSCQLEFCSLVNINRKKYLQKYLLLFFFLKKYGKKQYLKE